MKKMLNKLAAKAACTKAALISKLSAENGDTNFISIIVILGIVVLLVAVFMGFKDQIISTVTDIINGFEIH